jgi:peptidoglycan hydrolase-like protein with peptidoglycan-binding domain
MKRRLVVAATVLAALAVAAGCGSDGGSTTVTVTTTVPTTPATPTGPAVAELQRVMTRLGYYSGPIDGIYGDATTAGVKEMQTDLGVTSDGVYGPDTHAALRNKGHFVVTEFQTALAEYGYYTGPIDGSYGPATQGAVKKLQTDLGVTVDGRLGPETAKAFNDAVASGQLKPVSSSS